MRMIETYDKIINSIEECVMGAGDQTPMDQLRSVADEYGFYGSGLREFNAIFSFITNMKPLDYIKNRRMMRAYKILIEQKDFDVERAFVVAGYDNQNSFGKKFRSEFSMTPKKAWKDKNANLLTGPLFWNVLNGIDLKKEAEGTVEMIKTEDTIIGIDMRAYNKLIEFQNLCSSYGVRKEQGEVAYELAEKYGMELEDIFEYISEIPYVTKEMFIKGGCEMFFGDPDEMTVDEFDPKAYFMEMADDEDTIYCCTKCGFTYDEAGLILARLDESYHHYDIRNCSIEFLYACAHSDIHTHYLEQATNYYLKHDTDSFFDYERFDAYLRELEECPSYADAFEMSLGYMTEKDIKETMREEEMYNSMDNDAYRKMEEKERLDGFLDDLARRRGEW